MVRRLDICGIDKIASKLAFFEYFRCVVWTGDNRVFFFNPSTKTSLWECPPELKNKPEIQELMKAPPKPKDANQPPVNNKRPIDDETDSTSKEEENSKKIK